MAPGGPYDGTVTTQVTVTATLAPGYVWAQLPTGWSQQNSTTAIYPVNLVAASCTPATPVSPTVVQAACSWWGGDAGFGDVAAEWWGYHLFDGSGVAGGGSDGDGDGEVG